MLQLKSLQPQLEALEIVLDTAIINRGAIEEIQASHKQVKKVKQLIYERKVQLKRDGLYKEE